MAVSQKDIDAFLETKRVCLDLIYNAGHLSSTTNNNNNVCPTEWDGYVCWKATETGQSVTASCPKLLGSTEIIRECSVDGRWKSAMIGCKNAEQSTTTLLTTLANALDTSTGSIAKTLAITTTATETTTTTSPITTTTTTTTTTMSDFVDDGNLNEKSSSSPESSVTFDFGLQTTTAQDQPMTAVHGGFIYDYYKEVDIIRALVNCVSVVLLLTAIVFWFAVWCKSRYSHPYRCVSLICILAFSLLYHSVGVVTLLVYVPDGLGCQCVLTLKSYGDIGMYTFCFLYVILCIGIAMRRLESGAKFYVLVAIATLLPLILVIATTALRVLRHPDSYCDLLDELAHYLWHDRAPKTLLLFGTICILAVILYWLFCFDNTMFKLNRDFILIRHSSVTLMILVLFCFFLELYEIVFLRHTIDGQIKSAAIARSGLILNILMSAKGSVAAALLCFFDIEIFHLIYALPCCPDLGNAIIDQTWEKKIKSESKVKFFEDSSSDDNVSGKSSSRNPMTSSQESQKVLPEQRAVQGYGTVVHKDGAQQSP